MRRLALALVATTLIASPAWAGNPKAGVNFGSALCGKPFPCSGLSDGSIDRSTLANEADSCVRSKFNSSREESFFEGNSLDSNNCLTTRQMPKPAQGLTAVPVCCLAKDKENENMCQMRCKLLGVQ